MKKLVILLLSAIFISFIFTKPVQACECVDPGPGDPIGPTCQAGSTGSCVQAVDGIPCTSAMDCTVTADANCAACTAIDTIGNIVLPWVFGIGIFLAIIFLVTGGIRYITAGEDAKKIADAKGTVTWAVIGLVILVVAAGMVRLIWHFFGFEEGKIFLIPTRPGEGGVTDPVLDCTKCRT